MAMMVHGDLSSLYTFYSNMKFFGHYSIFEIDEMLPFEREIYFGLLSKTLDEQNKKGKQ
jgi:hypothetical protein